MGIQNVSLIPLNVSLIPLKEVYYGNQKDQIDN